MADLNPEQFRMQPKVNQKPGSQGVLFQGGHPAQPWPRGYSPERLRAVTESAKWLDPQRIYRPHAEATAKLRDTVARSTVPIEHINGLHFSATPHAAEKTESAEALGLYQRPGATALTGGLVSVHPDAVRGLTPIHEIGHHASHITQTEHAAYDTPARRGTEEGYAENYAETHFRDRRGKQERSPLGSLGWAGREESEEDRVALSRAFADKRKESPLAKREKPFDVNNMTKKQRGLPPEHIAGQTALIDKHGGGEYVQHPETGEWQPKPGPRDWDYTHEDRERGLRRERG